jgi:hypothetical protein
MIMHRRTGITWFNMFELLVEICLVINTLLLIVLFYLEHMGTDDCYSADRLVQYENLICYIVINCIEGAYIFFDTLARQAKRRPRYEAIETRPWGWMNV